MKTQYEKAQELLNKYDFPKFKDIEGRSSIADLFSKKNRCGIYIYRTLSDEYYIGQSIDCVKRYNQHLYRDIPDPKEFTFKSIPQKDLDAVEDALIYEAGPRGLKLKLRNIVYLPIEPDYQNDLEADIAINHKKAEAEVDYWLNNHIEFKLNKQKIVNPDLERVYHSKFIKLSQDNGHLKEILPFLKKYFSKCIIQPERTEGAFWVISCLPLIRKEIKIFSRISIYWQEVLTIGYDETDKKYVYSFHLKLSTFEDEDLEKLLKNYPHLGFDRHYYRKGGPDQFHIEVYNTKEAIKLLDEEIIIKSIKQFNISLMQKGPTSNIYGKFHCLNLSRVILG